MTQMAVDQLQATINGLHGTLVSLNDRRERWLHGSSTCEDAATDSKKVRLISTFLAIFPYRKIFHFLRSEDFLSTD